MGDVESWTVLGADDLPVAPVDRFLAHATTVERSPQSVRSYAFDLRDLFEFLAVAKIGWTSARLEDFGRFVGWLRVRRAPDDASPGRHRGGCSPSTVNRKL